MKNEDTKKKVTKKNNVNKGKDVKMSDTVKSKNTNKDVKKTTVKKEKKVKEAAVFEDAVKRESKPKREKKKNLGDIFLILGLVLVVILGCALMWGEKPKPKYQLPLTLTGDAGLHQLTYQEYQEKIDNDEHFVIIIERATCSYCVEFMPIAEGIAVDNGLPMYYVDTDTFSQEDWSTFETSTSYFKKKNGSWGTPTTLVQAGSETVHYLEGAVDGEKLLELYNNYFDMNNE